MDEGEEMPSEPRRSTNSPTNTVGIRDDSHEPHSLRDLVSVIALVLAGLQLIPAFLFPKAQWPLLALGMIAIGGGIFALLQLAKAASDTRRPFIPALLLILVATGAAGYKFYTEHDRVLSLEQQLAVQAGAGPVGEYLGRIVDLRMAQWDGRFESDYARPTLYLLNYDGTTKRTPLEMRDQILRWRTGTEGMNPQFRGVAGLVGELEPNEEPYAAADVVKAMLNYIDRPLADADLLNKRSSNPSANDIPTRLLVLGDPAAGKSTMLERLELVQARRARGTPDEPVPVLVTLGGFKEPSKDRLMSLVRDRLGSAADEVFATRKIILMLDGLDESERPSECAAAIAELASDAVWDRIIVAGRIHNYTYDLHRDKEALYHHGFQTAIMYGLDQTAIEKQILTLATPEERQKLLMTLANTKTRPAWMLFLRLPLNFRLISDLVMEYESDVLPRGQAELVGNFVEKRFAHRGINSADAEHCVEILTNAATSILRHDPNSRSKDFTIEQCLDENSLDARDDAARLDRIESRLAQAVDTGIISRGKRGGYSFFHLNVRDYFVARGLRDLTQVDPANGNWREILIFRAGMKDGSKVVDLVKQRAQGNAEVTALLADVTASQMAATAR